MLHGPCQHILVAYDFRKPFNQDFGKLPGLIGVARRGGTILFENIKYNVFWQRYKDGKLPPYLKIFTFDVDRYKLVRARTLKKVEYKKELYDFKLRNKVIRGHSILAFDKNLGIVTNISGEDALGAWVPLPLELEVPGPDLPGGFEEAWEIGNNIALNSVKKRSVNPSITTLRMNLTDDFLAHSYDYRLGLFSGLFNKWGNLPLGGDGAGWEGKHDSLSRPKFKCVQQRRTFWFNFRQLVASLGQETNDKTDYGYYKYYVTRLRPTSFYPLIDKLKIDNSKRQREVDRFKDVYHSNQEGGRAVPMDRAISDTLSYYKAILTGSEDELTRKYATRLLENDLHIADKNLTYIDNWRKYMVNNKKIYWVKIDGVQAVEPEQTTTNFLLDMSIPFLSAYLLPQSE